MACDEPEPTKPAGVGEPPMLEASPGVLAPVLVLLLRPRPFMAVPALANAFQKSAELKSTPLPTAAGEVAESEGVF